MLPVHQLLNLCRRQLNIQSIDFPGLFYAQAFIGNRHEQSVPFVSPRRLKGKILRRFRPRSVWNSAEALRAVIHQLQLNVALNQALRLDILQKQLCFLTHAHHVTADVIGNVKGQVLLIRIAVENIYL